MWTKNDAYAFRNDKRTEKLIEQLRSMKPGATGDTIESAALNARLRDGYDKCIENIIGLKTPQEGEIGGQQFVDTSK